jgi:hypothetical protein
VFAQTQRATLIQKNMAWRKNGLDEEGNPQYSTAAGTISDQSSEHGDPWLHQVSMWQPFFRCSMESFNNAYHAETLHMAANEVSLQSSITTSRQASRQSNLELLEFDGRTCSGHRFLRDQNEPASHFAISKKHQSLLSFISRDRCDGDWSPLPFLC